MAGDGLEFVGGHSTPMVIAALRFREVEMGVIPSTPTDWTVILMAVGAPA